MGVGVDRPIGSNFANLDLIEEMFDKYKQDPTSVDSSWISIFAALEAEGTAATKQIAAESSKSSIIYESPVGKYAKIDKSSPADLRIYNLIQAYRTYGHLLAKINPIATQPIQEPWQLSLDALGFDEQELQVPFPTCGMLPEQLAPLYAIIDTLKSIYCDNIGIEYMGLQNPQLEEWLQQHIEPNRFKADLTIQQKQMILQQLNRSELLESFIQIKYTGQKRFSLEGGETLIPMLEEIIETGSRLGMEECIIGMAHRGRLNVLCNILNKSYSDIFSEFEEGYIPNSFEGSGDVKYHKGFTSEVTTPDGRKVRIILPPNPSHLEAVDPVVEGEVLAKQISIGDDILQEKVIPILIHGDAAIAGQGVVYETLQLYQLPGYSTGGTIHFVINNQIGFTATANETRSTHYCTDIARAFAAPVFHVNAEDPEGCVYVTNLAIQLRQKFHCDVFIDLNCYRKYGHNEADEPAFTQPLEYQLIRKKRPIREIYRDQLIHEGTVERHIAEDLEKQFIAGLDKELQVSKGVNKASAATHEVVSDKDNNNHSEVFTAAEVFHPISTGVDKNLLQDVAKQFCSVPEGFTINQKLQNLLKERLRMVEEGDKTKPVDWGMAELLAYGTLLWNGTPVRISGQDCRRGTFSHRHAIWMDQRIEKAYSPLCHLKPDQGRFDVINSPLSEYAVLGFEFGYSVACPEALVIWEAQFGDFSNGAQIMIDQFIATTEQKWGQKLGLVMFLPHGYEGQGPEHSSGRMERFLVLAGENNMRIVNATTPAQFFHLLRRQVISPVRKPLIAFTPKGLLRHPACVSNLEEFTKGSFQEILDDPCYLSSTSSVKDVKRLVFCSGRIYYDLIAERAKEKEKDAKKINGETAIIRIEQLYPLHAEHLKELIGRYADVKEYVWAQEEPRNMGAWDFIHTQLRALLPDGAELKYVGRKRSASSATGSHAVHERQFEAIMRGVFG